MQMQQHRQLVGQQQELLEAQAKEQLARHPTDYPADGSVGIETGRGGTTTRATTETSEGGPLWTPGVGVFCTVRTRAAVL